MIIFNIVCGLIIILNCFFIYFNIKEIIKAHKKLKAAEADLIQMIKTNWNLEPLPGESFKKFYARAEKRIFEGPGKI